MRPILVPAPHRDPIRRLAVLSDPEFDALVDAASTDGRSIARARLSASVADALEWDDDAASVLLDSLLGAHSVHEGRQEGAADVAAAIADDPSLKLAETEKPTVTARLAQLLELEQLAAYLEQHGCSRRMSRRSVGLALSQTFVRSSSVAQIHRRRSGF